MSQRSIEILIRAAIVLSIFVTSLLSVYFCFKDPQYFREVFTREDGEVEWMTCVALFFIGVTFFRMGYLGKYPKKRSIALGIIFLFGAGEEISWGQRIFDFNIPSFMLLHNDQRELTLHNMKIGESFVIRPYLEYVLFGVSVSYFLLTFFFANTLPKVRRKIESWNFFIPRWDHLLCIGMMLWLAITINCYRKREVIEMGISLTTLSLVLFPSKRARNS